MIFYNKTFLLFIIVNQRDMIIFNKYISTSDVKAIGILTIFLLIAEK